MSVFRHEVGAQHPIFNDPADRVALGLLSELFTDRPAVGIHAVDLVWGLGTLSGRGWPA